jgi:opacity protein-like surface antigen
MKQLMICSLLLAIAASSHAQEESGRVFKPFKVDLSAGFALPMGGEGTKVGGLFALEPKYAVADQFALGLRMEIASMARVINLSSGEDLEGDVQANGSFILTGDYLFNKSNFRPFVGAGLGSFGVAAAPLDENLTEDDILSESKFGFMVRAGFETGHFRLGVEYNIVGSTSFSANNNYIGFKIGGFFGGGRLRK